MSDAPKTVRKAQGIITFDRDATPLFKKVVVSAIEESPHVSVSRIGTTNQYRLVRVVSVREIGPGQE